MNDIYSLTIKNEHMFLELENGLWLIDTGAPSSFGEQNHLKLCGKEIAIQAKDYIYDVS